MDGQTLFYRTPPTTFWVLKRGICTFQFLKQGRIKENLLKKVSRDLDVWPNIKNKTISWNNFFMHLIKKTNLYKHPFGSNQFIFDWIGIRSSKWPKQWYDWNYTHDYKKSPHTECSMIQIHLKCCQILRVLNKVLTMTLNIAIKLPKTWNSILYTDFTLPKTKNISSLAIFFHLRFDK